jgi:hypothetical protein
MVRYAYDGRPALRLVVGPVLPLGERANRPKPDFIGALTEERGMRREAEYRYSSDDADGARETPPLGRQDERPPLRLG